MLSDEDGDVITASIAVLDKLTSIGKYPLPVLDKYFRANRRSEELRNIISVPKAEGMLAHLSWSVRRAAVRLLGSLAKFGLPTSYI